MPACRALPEVRLRPGLGGGEDPPMFQRPRSLWAVRVGMEAYGVPTPVQDHARRFIPSAAL